MALYGELGSGKSVLARGVIHGLGVEETLAVTSPTFIIVNEYTGRLPVHHVDAYRLRGAKDILALGSRELLFDQAVSVVEWADKVEDALPDGRVNVSLEITGPTARRISISASGPCREALSSLAEDLALEEDARGPQSG